MKKQNFHPNKRTDIRQKKYSDKTPDAKSSKTFKPRFIVKQSQQPSPIVRQKRITQSFNDIRNLQSDEFDDGCSSPHVNKNWKNQYRNAQNELEQRTDKFEEIIKLCSYIMQDISKNSQLKNVGSYEEMESRLIYVNQKSKMLLETFSFFQRNN